MNPSKLWPERILVFGLALWFFVNLHREIPAVSRVFAGASLTVIGLLIVRLRNVLGRFSSPIWRRTEDEAEAMRFLYLEFGVLIAIGGGTLLLRALA